MMASSIGAEDDAIVQGGILGYGMSGLRKGTVGRV